MYSQSVSSPIESMLATQRERSAVALQAAQRGAAAPISAPNKATQILNAHLEAAGKLLRCERGLCIEAVIKFSGKSRKWWYNNNVPSSGAHSNPLLAFGCHPFLTLL